MTLIIVTMVRNVLYWSEWFRKRCIFFWQKLVLCTTKFKLDYIDQVISEHFISIDLYELMLHNYVIISILKYMYIIFPPENLSVDVYVTVVIFQRTNISYPWDKQIIDYILIASVIYFILALINQKQLFL